MVGGDRVAEHAEHTRAVDRANARRRHRHPLEVRRVLHVRRIGLPAVARAGAGFDVLPVLVAEERVGVLRGELLTLHAGENRVFHFLRNVFQFTFTPTRNLQSNI